MIRPPTRHHMLDYLPRGGIVAEIGVADGKFAQAMLAKLQPGRLYLIDPWPPGVETAFGATGDDHIATVRRRFSRHISTGQVVAIISPTPHGFEILPPCDVIYIDGDHRYEAVAKDLDAAWQRIKPGGWICGHDYCDIFQRGVPRAVDEFVARHGLKIDMLTEERPLPCNRRFGINADLPAEIAYNSFAIHIPGTEARK